jgi:hypothetical protein
MFPRHFPLIKRLGLRLFTSHGTTADKKKKKDKCDKPRQQGMLSLEILQIILYHATYHWQQSHGPDSCVPVSDKREDSAAEKKRKETGETRSSVSIWLFRKM